MGRRNCRKGTLRAEPGSISKQRPSWPSLFRTRAQRRAMLAGTALASTLAFAAPTPAAAQVLIVSNFPIRFTNTQDCVFVGFCASINTAGTGAFIDFTNTGDFLVTGLVASALNANTIAPFSSITITNTGDIATFAAGVAGISATTTTLAINSPITIINSGDIATAGLNAYGIAGVTGLANSSLSITNSGGIATLGVNADGLSGRTSGANSPITIVNSGGIATRGVEAEGINAKTTGSGSPLLVVNSGTIATSGFFAEGIYGATTNAGSPLTIQSSGRVRANGLFAYGINALTQGSSSPISIETSGEVYGTTAAIRASSNTSTTITNKGSISAGSGLAIDTVGASTTIYNSGLISGFIDLTDQSDLFVNRAGGEFNAMATSNFRGGSDLFRNDAGATLRTARQYSNGEETNFVGLKRFENEGLITMVDGRDNDVFRIANTPGAKDLTFVGSGNSTLAIDAFLGGPGSTADHFIVDGDTFGRTAIAVNDTNPSSARYDPIGIPVVFVEGKIVNENNFYVPEPIDAGFFDYDLFFQPTGSGFFELKNHTGGGAHLLPELVTATHDTFHNTTETWFDQSTDLRVLLEQGATCSKAQRAQHAARCQELYNFTPGVWVRGAGTWFDLQDSATTNANGRTYHHNLNRKLGVGLFEAGMDFGKQDLFAPGDILVFGLLGGATQATLSYTAIDRNFDLNGGEVGAYATYLRGGFFADTLFKSIFAELDPKEVRGFPDTLDTVTYGFRTDTGYRFGGFRRGPFVEPLGTIAASWSHIDDFALDGNAVNFNDDTNVRGRVGLRLGTSTDVWQGTRMEPFVVGSLWGTLSGNHTTSLTSTGTVFAFTDEPEDLWRVVSGGVNFFNPSAQTAVFAKVDYTFADQTQGVGVRGGMRYNW